MYPFHREANSAFTSNLLRQMKQNGPGSNSPNQNQNSPNPNQNSPNQNSPNQSSPNQSSPTQNQSSPTPANDRTIPSGLEHYYQHDESIRQPSLKAFHGPTNGRPYSTSFLGHRLSVDHEIEGFRDMPDQSNPYKTNSGRSNAPLFSQEERSNRPLTNRTLRQVEDDHVTRTVMKNDQNPFTSLLLQPRVSGNTRIMPKTIDELRPVDNQKQTGHGRIIGSQMGAKSAVAPTIIMTRPDMTRVEQAEDFVQKGGVFQRQQVKGELALPTTHRDLALSVDIANKATSLMTNTVAEQRMIDGHSTHLGLGTTSVRPVIQPAARNQYQETDDLTKNAGSTTFSKAAQHATPNVPQTERDKLEKRSFYGTVSSAGVSAPAVAAVAAAVSAAVSAESFSAQSNNRIDVEHQQQQTMSNTRNRTNLEQEQYLLANSGRENMNHFHNSSMIHQKTPISILRSESTTNHIRETSATPNRLQNLQQPTKTSSIVPESTTNHIRETSATPNRLQTSTTNSILRSESTSASLVRDLTLHAQDRHNIGQQRPLTLLPESVSDHTKQRYSDSLSEQRTHVELATRFDSNQSTPATVMKQTDIGNKDRRNANMARFGVGDRAEQSYHVNKTEHATSQASQVDAGPRRFADNGWIEEQTVSFKAQDHPHRDHTSISTNRHVQSVGSESVSDSVSEKIDTSEIVRNRQVNHSNKASIRTDESTRFVEQANFGVSPNINRSTFEAPVGFNVAARDNSDLTTHQVSHNRGNEQVEMFNFGGNGSKPTVYEADATANVPNRHEVVNENFSGLRSTKAKVSPLDETVGRSTNRQLDSVLNMSRSARADTTSNSASMRQAMAAMTTTLSGDSFGEINSNYTGNAFERSKPKVYELDDEQVFAETNRNTYAVVDVHGSVNAVGPQHQPLVSRDTFLVNDAKNEQELLHSQRFDGTTVRGPERTPDKDSFGAVANRDDAWVTQTRLPGKGTFVR